MVLAFVLDFFYPRVKMYRRKILAPCTYGFLDFNVWWSSPTTLGVGGRQDDYARAALLQRRNNVIGDRLADVEVALVKAKVQRIGRLSLQVRHLHIGRRAVFFVEVRSFKT